MPRTRRPTGSDATRKCLQLDCAERAVSYDHQDNAEYGRSWTDVGPGGYGNDDVRHHARGGGGSAQPVIVIERSLECATAMRTGGRYLADIYAGTAQVQGQFATENGWRCDCAQCTNPAQNSSKIGD